ncbi:DUF6153 family protein [Streptomyces flavidovirens]|uniref:DUF6153 family protein n=1 Tax=Streptomyces flavidovirens TaxID=67298 RepID=A0ABW6RN43_9ACTN
MSQQAWRAARPRGARLYALLVLTVLAGLVAMHGLAPGVPPGPSAAVVEVHHAAAPSHSDAVDGADGAHAGHGEGGAGGHAEHADPTCAAGGTSGAPALPAPAVAGVVACPSADAPALLLAATPGARAPPTLSQLQLLRI